MATILILTKLRRIPKTCADCRYYQSKTESGWGDAPSCKACEMPMESKIRHGRQAWCPLVESHPCKTIVDTRKPSMSTDELIALRGRLPMHWEDWRLGWSAFHKNEDLPLPYPDDLEYLLQIIDEEIKRARG